MVLVAWPCLVGCFHMASCALAAFLKAEMLSSRYGIDVAGKNERVATHEHRDIVASIMSVLGTRLHLK